MSFDAISGSGVGNTAGQAQTLAQTAQAAQPAGAGKPAGTACPKDSVEISEQGKKLAATQKQEAAKIAGKNNVIASMTFKSGRTVNIEKVIFENESDALDQPGTFTDEHRATRGQKFGFRVNIFDPTGRTEKTFLLREDTILNEDESGKLQMKKYVEGAETEGNDLIIGLEGKNLRGGDGDDTIVELSGSHLDDYDYSLESLEIDTGNGNDTVFVQGDVSTGNRIMTGDGNDSVRVSLCRSEERRVGKECRSRWSPYH